MTTTWKQFASGVALTGSAVSVYEAPGLTASTIQATSVTNATAAPVLVNLYLVPNGSAWAATYRIASKTVPAAGCLPMPESINHKLEAGAQLYADGNGANITISGTEYVPNT